MIDIFFRYFEFDVLYSLDFGTKLVCRKTKFSIMIYANTCNKKNF